jgi:heme/copper-type cytochrome/quinol oxidase subunit 2
MENTAKNFALQLGSLITLYISLGALLALIFAIINIAFPDAADSYWRYESATSAIRFSIATLIVFFPTYLVLTRYVNNIRRNESGMYLTLTKWLIYLSLLVGGAIILGDLVAVILAFLNGELVITFILKALAIFIVIGAAFTYYLLDAKGHWQKNERLSVTYGAATLLIVLIAIIIGFLYSEPPTEIRERKIDDNQVQDLRDFQWRIEEYYRVNSMLPESTDVLYQGISVPTAPDERMDYSYVVDDSNTFRLCAEFLYASQDTMRYPEPTYSEKTILNPNNWDHGAGEWCFERIVE